MSLLQTIREARVRDDVVADYASAIVVVVDRYTEDTDWIEVNQAIIDRWSLAALAYIKDRAWKRIEARP